MSDYYLSCCSTADLSKEHFEKRGIRYVCFHFELGGTDYLDDMGKSMPPEELYKRMLAGEETRTSQVSVGEYVEHFENMLKEGKTYILTRQFPIITEQPTARTKQL